MDELVDIVDENGIVSGLVCLKSEAHRKGYWHPSINVWLFTKDGEILIQKRVDTKDTFPGLWDVSVAGHIGASEQPIASAQREVFEEIGLGIDAGELMKIGTYRNIHRHSDILIDREFQYVYIAELTVPMDRLKLQPEEVAELKLLPISELKKVVFSSKKEGSYVPYSQEYFNMVFKAVEEQISLI